MEFPLSSGAQGLGKMQTSTQAIRDRVVGTVIRVRSGSCELTGGTPTLGDIGNGRLLEAVPYKLRLED